jgi:hypothetical protein
MAVMVSNRLKYLLIMFALVLIVMLSLRVLNRRHYFEVVALDNAEVILKQEVKPGARFSTTFKHSVQLSDWTDFFEITDDWQFRLYETHFADMGWGFPSEPDPGAKMEMTPEYIRYYDMNRVMRSFQVAVTTANDRHFLQMDGFLVDLVQKAGPGRLLEFRISH